MTIEECCARVEIAHLNAQYVRCADGRLWDEMEEIWATDAVVLPPGGARFEGRDAIMARFRGNGLRSCIEEAAAARARKAAEKGDEHFIPLPPLKFTRHQTSSGWIDILGPDEAVGQFYFATMTNAGFDHSSTYRDKYRRVEGRWFIAERKTRIDYLAPNALFTILKDAMAIDAAEERS